MTLLFLKDIKKMEAKDDELQTNFGHRWSPLVASGRRWLSLVAAGCCWLPLVAAGHICTYFATCSWEPLTMLKPHFVAGEHGLFGAHESKDIRSIYFLLLFKESKKFFYHFLCS